MGWERCGNTPYYRSGDGGGWKYVNPFNWTQISVAPDSQGPKGHASILYRQAPRYDWDMIKAGVTAVAGGKDEQNKILRSIHGWANDLFRAKELKMKPADLQKIFKEAPKEDQEQVLVGVGALVNGYDTAEMMDFRHAPEQKTLMLLAVEKGSPADKKVESVLDSFVEPPKVFVADTLAQAIEDAMAYLGVHEC